MPSAEDETSEDGRMIKEFRDFIARGNLVEIAVAFVMGAAFGGVVSALTSRIVSPLLAMIVDLPALDNVWTFGPVDPATGQPQGSVGALVGAVINFLIVALVMFFTVRSYTKLRDRPEEAEPPTPPEDIILLREIRDSLRDRS